MRKKLFLVIIETNDKLGLYKKDDDNRPDIVILDQTQFSNLVANIDEEKYDIAAVDIIEVEKDNDYMKYVKKDDSLEHGQQNNSGRKR